MKMRQQQKTKTQCNATANTYIYIDIHAPSFMGIEFKDPGTLYYYNTHSEEIYSPRH